MGKLSCDLKLAVLNNMFWNREVTLNLQGIWDSTFSACKADGMQKEKCMTKTYN